jgi:hypothetical protein
MRPQILGLSLLIAIPVAGEDATGRIHQEIQRLQQSLKDRPISNPDIPNGNIVVGDGLKAADDLLKAGSIYLSLERLVQAEDLLNGARSGTDRAEAVKSGMQAFEAEWSKSSRIVAVFNQQNGEWKNAPAALRAVAETARARTLPLLDGGRGFATATHPKDGLIYLGEAEGQAEFAKFCGTLAMRRHGEQYPLRSMLPELIALQEKTNAAFLPPRSIELHSRFIALNSTLKLARELDARRSHAGSLYQYLEAVRHYGMLDVPAPDSAKLSEIKEGIGRMQGRLGSSKRDDSIAQLFLQRAGSQVAHLDGSAPSADELRSARVILEQVLPAYFDTYKRMAPMLRASGKTIDITLVRWPYT